MGISTAMTEIIPRFRRSSRRLRVAADYLDGLPTKIIMDVHAIGNRELQRIRKGLHLPSRRNARRKELSKEIANSYRAGIHIKAIAATLNISARTVRRFVFALDLPRRRPTAFERSE